MMGCYLKSEVGTEMGSEMEGSVCTEDKFRLSEMVFLPFQEEFKWLFSVLSTDIILLNGTVR